jgi:glycolate dehydrogenase FAD-binding subunit
MASSAPLTPANEADLAAMIRACAGAKRGLVTEGSGTKRHFGPSAPAGTERVSLRALHRVIAYEPEDMVVSVEAGIRLADLQRELAVHHQWLPVDPPFSDATIGGVLATHSSGARRLAYGTVKDMLLGARVIGASGVASKSGGRVVKNVSGYDLHKLQVGAFGSLGVLVEANFRVSALPEAAAVLWLAAPSLATSHQTLLEIAATSLRPCALEALDPHSADDLAAAVPDLPRQMSLAVIGIEGSRPILERHLRDLAGLRTRAVASGLIEGPGLVRFWEALRDLSVRHASDITLRLGARPHDLAQLLGRLEPLEARHTGTVVQAALGVARVSVTPSENVSSLVAAMATWQLLAMQRGGYAVVESAPLDCPGRERLPWACRGDHALGALAKHRWDPDQVLNPGRMAC